VANGPQGKRPDWWPREPAGYVFLAHAVEKIGSALHGDDWTGEEATAEEIEPLPCNLKEASPYNRRQAEELLQRHRPDLGRPAVIGWNGWNEFSEDDWKIAYELEQRLRPALKRLQATQSEIVKRHETDELELKIRPRSGGPWRDFNKDWWNTDKWRSHFDRCRIDPEYPNGNRPSWSEDDDHWIFVTSKGLNRVETALGPKATAGAEKRAISHLKPLLDVRRDAMSKGEAWNECKQFNISHAGFENHVWPKARELAGLERKAPPGKKKREPVEDRAGSRPDTRAGAEQAEPAEPEIAQEIEEEIEELIAEPI